MNRMGKWKTRMLFSRSALAVALATGLVAGSAFVSSPAEARKKKEEDGPKLEFSKGFVAVAGPAQKEFQEAAKKSDVEAARNQLDAAIDSGNDQQIAAARAAMNTALSSELATLDKVFGAVENPSDKFLAGNLAVNLGSTAGDPRLQRRGIKAMLDSGMSDPAQVPRFNAVAGQLAYQAGDYAEAAQYLQKAVDAGFTENNSEVILAEAYINNNKPTEGLAILKKAIQNRKASGNLAPDSWYRRGLISAYKANQLDTTADFGAMLIRDYPEPANIGAAVTIVRELGDFNSQEMLDLMRLMGQTKSYAEERDYVEYIQAADPRRLPGEVLDVIKAGVAAGKLNPTDTFVSDAKSQATEREASDRASLSSYANDARKPGAPVATITGAADALLSYGEAAQAAELYKSAIAKNPADLPALYTRLGIAQVDQGKYGEAQASFAKVTGKRTSIAKLWSAYAAEKAAAASAPAPAAATSPATEE